MDIMNQRIIGILFSGNLDAVIPHIADREVRRRKIFARHAEHMRHSSIHAVSAYDYRLAIA